MEEKMEYQLDERTRDMQEAIESCQTRVCFTQSNIKLEYRFYLHIKIPALILSLFYLIVEASHL